MKQTNKIKKQKRIADNEIKNDDYANILTYKVFKGKGIFFICNTTYMKKIRVVKDNIANVV